MRQRDRKEEGERRREIYTEIDIENKKRERESERE